MLAVTRVGLFVSFVDVTIYIRTTENRQREYRPVHTNASCHETNPLLPPYVAVFHLKQWPSARLFVGDAVSGRQLS